MFLATCSLTANQQMQFPCAQRATAASLEKAILLTGLQVLRESKVFKYRLCRASTQRGQMDRLSNTAFIMSGSRIRLKVYSLNKPYCDLRVYWESSVWCYAVLKSSLALQVAKIEFQTRSHDRQVSSRNRCFCSPNEWCIVFWFQILNVLNTS